MDGDVSADGSAEFDFRFHDACGGRCQPVTLKIFLNSALMHASPFDCAMQNSTFSISSIPAGRNDVSVVLEDPDLYVCLIDSVKFKRPAIDSSDPAGSQFRDDQFSAMEMENVEAMEEALRGRTTLNDTSCREKIDPSKLTFDTSLSPTAFAGLVTTLHLQIKDKDGRAIRNCVRPGFDVYFDGSVISSAVSFVQSEGLLRICFISLDPQVGVAVDLFGKPLRGSPFVFNLSHVSLATSGCARPGVSKLTSPCLYAPESENFITHDGLDKRLRLPEEEELDETVVWSGGASDSRVSSARRSFTAVESVTVNVFRVSNACVVNRSLVFFEESGETRRTRSPQSKNFFVGSHFWGQWEMDVVRFPVDFVEESYESYVERVGVNQDPESYEDLATDGVQGSGTRTGAVYLIPEGPTTHFGHMLMDVIVPLYVMTTTVGDQRGRKRVVLWPWPGFHCPLKGGRVHSKRFWDLLSAVTSEPQEDVKFLASLEKDGHCYREIVLGQPLDFRVGYWQGFVQRTIPFMEDFVEAITSMKRTLMVKLHAVGASAAAVKASDQHTAIIVSRHERRILNQADLTSLAMGMGLKVQVCNWQDMPIIRQVEVMAGADLLVGVHGVGMWNMVFARKALPIIDILMYCHANASDHWELSQLFKLRHYVWRNPDPDLASCDLTREPNCGVPACGYNPASDAFAFGGGTPNVQLQDTRVDLRAMERLLLHARSYLDWLRLPEAEGAGTLATSCSLEPPLGEEQEVVCAHEISLGDEVYDM
ncbi:hypothetical protein GUITHDRAFT_100000 [Guillardia theta CCMP2712]|uniref:EGF domain-specific O-linked N-acetylglucosamine transferase n=2 Tax=Guillardia theta TaxID=55529 RepID=L1K2C0_GUITC|nr:hypothetical protein GUITHDRAFT_100000 [Guillardia theta CCMP2712]EKX54523.1 hypothetical protein GUITHDRAFT_100000 [Guillardia theta CCMP2712]|eukprot:XP_005841503.1 hypothetical protein GUITHDRAFT_100000 [Guillardia theta CCMP2712]